MSVQSDNKSELSAAGGVAQLARSKLQIYQKPDQEMWNPRLASSVVSRRILINCFCLFSAHTKCFVVKVLLRCSAFC